MATEILNLHPETPELRKISKVADFLRDGGVILYPADTGFCLGCNLSNKEAIARIRSIRRLPENKEMTFLCDTLSNIAEFAKVSNSAYKTIKRLIPGPFTFILPASKQVPKFAQNPRRNTAGIRVPENVLAQLLLKELETPMISISAVPREEMMGSDPDEIIRRLAPQVDIAVSSSIYDFAGPSTVIDMTDEEFKVIRAGAEAEFAQSMLPEAV
ncbi:MAG: L-threonylcarbamoyladenylate synthase [Chloroflexota bacterium]